MSIETAKIINNLLEVQEKKQKDLINYLNKVQSTVAKWLSENKETNRDIPYDLLIEISTYFNVSTDILLGKENKLVDNFHIPLIGKASCGKPKDYELNGYETVPIPKEIYKVGMYAIEAEGQSMSPKINENDIVYCNPSLHVDCGNIVHYNLDGESGIKKYKINEAGTIISLIPINSEYEIIVIHFDENRDLRMSKVVGKIDKDF
jgi:SOS-response transcriptional repressor LexA